MTVREELLEASDAVIEDAVQYAEPIVLRGLLYQLTGDESLAAIAHGSRPYPGFRGEVPAVVDPADIAQIRAKAVAYLKAYRDAGAPADVPLGPPERLHRSMELASGATLGQDELGLWLEQLVLDPFVRGHEWSCKPRPEQLENFLVVVIGAGMGGLNAAVQLKRAGIPYVVVEKNGEVGGTWHENRYPGARVDTFSRTYFHAFGIDYHCPGPFCDQAENERYFNWVADRFEVRDSIVFDTEVESLVWKPQTKTWDVRCKGPDGPKTWQANAVITAVGFLSRPNIPPIPGSDEFGGRIVHTASWPDDLDLAGKRVAVVGSGATGYQTLPVIAQQAAHVTLYQLEPSWVFEVDGYLSKYPPQVNWLDRNFPYLINFNHFQASWVAGPEGVIPLFERDPEFRDEEAFSTQNKRLRELGLATIHRKLAGRPDLIEKMIPRLPPMTSRPLLVDSSDNIYDALKRDNVELVSGPIDRITSAGVVSHGVEQPVDLIVYATGYRANEFLWPMDVRGRDGVTVGDLWSQDGARGYLGTMLPGFPNFFMLYGPNTNPFGNGLGIVELEEMATRFALKCVEAIMLDDAETVEVTRDAYDRYNAVVDRLEVTKIYSDPRINNYLQNQFHRSAVNNPIDVRWIWDWLRDPLHGDFQVKGIDPSVRPKIGEDLVLT